VTFDKDPEFFARAYSICHGWGILLVLLASRNSLLREFFGLIRRHSFGDHRFQTAERIRVRTALVASIMYRCNLEIRHRHCNNLGGVCLGEDKPEFTDMNADVFYESLCFLCDLGPIWPPKLPVRLLRKTEIEAHIRIWATRDDRHSGDRGFQASFAGWAAKWDYGQISCLQRSANQTGANRRQSGTI
jgi:hypothetical protein